MFDMMYDTARSGWIGAYVFDTFDVVANRFRIGLVQNITESGEAGAIGEIGLIDNALLQYTTNRNNSLTVLVKVCRFLTYLYRSLSLSLFSLIILLKFIHLSLFTAIPNVGS